MPGETSAAQIVKAAADRAMANLARIRAEGPDAPVRPYSGSSFTPRIASRREGSPAPKAAGAK